MPRTYRISDTYNLTVDVQRMTVSTRNGTPVASLPCASFLQGGLGSCTAYPKNNHYHTMQSSVSLWFNKTLIETLEEQPEALVIHGHLECEGMEFKPSFSVSISERAGGIAIAGKLEEPLLNRITISLSCWEWERLYGFGEQFTYVDFTGKRFPLVVGEQGLGRGAEPCSSIVEARSGSAGDAFTTYAPLATAVSSAFRAFHVANTCIMTVDASHQQPGVLSFELWNDRVDLHVWRGSSISECISLHTAFTGRYRSLPPWAHGFIAGLRGGREEVERILGLCENFDIPVSAIWIEDWVGRRGPNYGPPLWWRWQPNESVYPDFTAWVASLARKNIRVLTYFNPFIADDHSFHQCREGLEHGYFVRDAEGKPYLKKTGMGYGYYMVDLSNPKAFEWLRQIMVESVASHGIAGWMADYGEYLSFDCRLANGMTGEQYHQQYALDWIRLNREAIEAAGIASDCLVFNRCGFGEVNKHAQCFWEGDQNVTWDEHDGLASSIVGLLSGGLSGIAINHSDIGGHTTLVNPLFSMVRTQELLWRWTELAVFQPVMRTHVGTLQTPNHQFYSDHESLVFFGLMTRLHACFSEYFEELEAQAEATGLPVIRHTMIHDQTAMTMDLRYQFMLGSDVVVFPVWESRSRMVRGYIPEGAWIDPWNNRSLDGGCWETFDAPYGKPAFLIRSTSRQGTALLAKIQAFAGREQVVFASIGQTIPKNSTGTEGTR